MPSGVAIAEPTELDSALLLYVEGRVAAYEITADARRELPGGRALSARFLVDILTGASPNGATPSHAPQSFTRPSGRGSYRVDPDETPLDDTFQDNRVAISLGYAQPLTSNTLWNVGAGGSIEYDYRALHVSTGLSHDLFLKNTTLAASVSYSSDRWRPEGGVPEPFAAMTRPGSPLPRLSRTETKQVIDVVAGVTQVLSRTMLARLNYSLSSNDGYLTDPFKLLSVVRGAGDPEAGVPVFYVFEHRPDVRHRHSMFAQLRTRIFSSDVLDLSYRYGWDTWAVRSHTAEVRFRHRMGREWFMQPHLRVYHQTAAEFHRRFLIELATTPDFASADYRLAEFDALTVGVEWGRDVAGLGLLSATVEYYGQLDAQGGPAPFGELAEVELYPALHAVMLRLRYSGAW